MPPTSLALTMPPGLEYPERRRHVKRVIAGRRSDANLSDQADLPHSLLLLRRAPDPREARQEGRARGHRGRDLGDQRLSGDHGTYHQRRVRRTLAPRPRARVPGRARGTGLAWSALPDPAQVPRRLAHAPRPPPRRRRDRPKEARRATR